MDDETIKQNQIEFISNALWQIMRNCEMSGGAFNSLRNLKYEIDQSLKLAKTPTIKSDNTQTIINAQKEIERLEKELATANAVLLDPAALHMNILRGTVTLERQRALHIAGAADYDETKKELAEARENSIKSIWGDKHPHAIFLTDGTKISIGGNKRGCWLEIGKAAKIIAHNLDAIKEIENLNVREKL